MGKKMQLSATKSLFSSAEDLFIYLIIVGYVVASGIAIPFHIENSRIFAVPFRILIFLFSCLIILRNFKSKRFWNISVISFIIFWLYYIVKTYYSISTDYYNADFLKSADEIYARIVTIVVIPSFACMMLDYSKINFADIFIKVFYTFIIMLCLNLIYGLLTFEKFPLLGIFSVYYISAGHLGTSLFLISFFFILFRKEKAVRSPTKLLTIFGAVIGLSTVFFLAARSPILALVTVLLFYLIIINKRQFYFIFCLSLVILVTAVYLIGEISPESENNFFSRTYRWIFLGDNSSRTPLFEMALSIFKDNPIFGGRIQYEDGMYPHNIFLELLMATGIIGFILYFVKFVPVVRNLKIFISNKINVYYILVFALFLQYFVLVITSFNLYSVPEFVQFSGIVIGISLTYIYEKTKGDDGRGNTSRNY